MLHDLLVAAGGTAGLVIAWIAVQGLKRRSDPAIGTGEDVLSCAHCGRGGSCGGCEDPGAAARGDDRRE